MSDYTLEGLIQLGAKELARRYLINERVRKHWRILAAQAALGQITLESIKMVCFREVLGVVPTEEDLDRELAEIVDRMEADEAAREDLEAMFGKSRTTETGFFCRRT
jgi:hypothetical protein